MIYETAILANHLAIQFIVKFNSKVGTENEITAHGDWNSSVTCFELEGNEVDICKEIENSLK